MKRFACEKLATRRRLSDLEAELRSIQPTVVKLIDDKRQKLVIDHTLTRQVDGAHHQLLALIG
jgi:hypothetical protein